MNAFLEQFKVTGIESPAILPCDEANDTQSKDDCGGVCGHCGGGYCGDGCGGSN